MRFLVDNQLPAALARMLDDHGWPCQHVLDVGLAQVPDRAVWEYVSEHQMILISKDEDFTHLANRPAASARLIWIRTGNCRKQALLDALLSAWPRILSALDSGERIVEVR